MYTPYELLCEQDKYQVLIYVGITGQVDSDRSGEYIWKKYEYASKFAMIDDGWIILKNVVQFLEYDFLCRRYTTAWTKRLLQLYTLKLSDTVSQCNGWKRNKKPIFGENRSNLKDNGMNFLYVCFKLE